MLRSTALLLLIMMIVCLSPAALAQTFDLQFVVMVNDGTNFDVKVQLKANSSTFALGTSNFIFSFNGASLSNPTLQTAHNFSGTAYQPMNLGGSGTSRSVNIELNTAGTGTTVTTSYMDVATIRFTVTNPAGNANLQWNAGAGVVYKDDETNTVPPGTLNNLDTTPLPVQLASFSAGLNQGGSGVLLSWSTASEVNNYGFTVQRKGGKRPGVCRSEQCLPGREGNDDRAAELQLCGREHCRSGQLQLPFEATGPERDALLHAECDRAGDGDGCGGGGAEGIPADAELSEPV